MALRSWITSSLTLLGVCSLAATFADAADHPRDPWVFRSVLDGRARMLTAAFHDKLYVAYDTQDCTLRRAWAGDVKFTGGVYDARHGPQPQSEGPAYFQTTDDAHGWSLNPSNNGKLAFKPRYLGYRVAGDKVSLNFEFRGTDRVVTVEESPSCEMKGEAVTLVRTVKVAGLTEGAKLTLSLAHKAEDPEVEIAVEPTGSPAQAFTKQSTATAPASGVVINQDGTVRVRMTWRVK